jgi:large subunit ribosomal protein L23
MSNASKNVLKTLHVTEKSEMLQGLVDANSNPSLKRCNTAKYVFLVHPDANKHQIKQAVEEAYASQKCKVVKVNTITLPRKKKRVRGSAKQGETNQLKKAIVTLREGDRIIFEE